MRRWLDYLALGSTGYSRWWMPMHGTQVPAHHAAAPRPPLVTGASADRVQACHSRLPFSAWYSSAVYSGHASCALWQTLTRYGDYVLRRRQRSLVASTSATVPSALSKLPCGPACRRPRRHYIDVIHSFSCFQQGSKTLLLNVQGGPEQVRTRIWLSSWWFGAVLYCWWRRACATLCRV